MDGNGSITIRLDLRWVKNRPYGCKVGLEREDGFAHTEQGFLYMRKRKSQVPTDVWTGGYLVSRGEGRGEDGYRSFKASAMTG